MKDNDIVFVHDHAKFNFRVGLIVQCGKKYYYKRLKKIIFGS